MEKEPLGPRERPANNLRVGPLRAYTDEMKILDYETNKTLNDVAIYLTQDEASELVAFLKRLVDKPHIHKIHLSEIVSNHLEKELTFAIDPCQARAA